MKTIISTYFLLSMVCNAADQSNKERIVILVNKNSPESMEIGRLYAKARAIPDKQLLELKCSTKEVISRDEYNATIRDPLFAFLLKKERFSKVRYLAICYGLPLKIKKDEHAKRSHCALDNELCLVLWKNHDRSGWVQNPYYGQDVSISGMAIPGLLLATRLDGPTPEIAKGLAQKALAGEKLGVYGKGYFDLRGIKSGAYAQGDRWIDSAFQSCKKYGYFCERDDKGSLLGEHYPMPDPAFYFGWYSSQMAGPFLAKGFRFRPGAELFFLGEDSPKHSKRVLTAVRTPTPITMDGKEDDVWLARKGIKGFTVKAEKPPEGGRETEVKALYDDRALYLFIRNHYPDLATLKLDPDLNPSQIWMAESVEIFLSPARDYSQFLQLMANPDAKKWSNKFSQKNWNKDWEVATQKTENAWTLEVAIPFASFKRKTPANGEAWGANFGRNSGKTSSWSPIKGSFHQPVKFGYILFESPKDK